jgi:hypothetical protein
MRRLGDPPAAFPEPSGRVTRELHADGPKFDMQRCPSGNGCQMDTVVMGRADQPIRACGTARQDRAVDASGREPVENQRATAARSWRDLSAACSAREVGAMGQQHLETFARELREALDCGALAHCHRVALSDGVTVNPERMARVVLADIDRLARTDGRGRLTEREAQELHDDLLYLLALAGVPVPA